MTVDTTSFDAHRINLDLNPDASAGTWTPANIDEIAFTGLAANRTFDIDHIDLATAEYQFLQFNNFKENIDNFNYFSGEMRISYRSHGVPRDILS